MDILKPQTLLYAKSFNHALLKIEKGVFAEEASQ